jgi:hypothetical protein
MSIQKSSRKPITLKEFFCRRYSGANRQACNGASAINVYKKTLFLFNRFSIFQIFNEEKPTKINFIETVFNYRSLADRVSYRLHTQIEVWLKFAVKLICFTVRKAQYLGTLYYTHNFRCTHWQDKDIDKTPNIVCNSLYI